MGGIAPSLTVREEKRKSTKREQGWGGRSKHDTKKEITSLAKKTKGNKAGLLATAQKLQLTLVPNWGKGEKDAEREAKVVGKGVERKGMAPRASPSKKLGEMPAACKTHN